MTHDTKDSKELEHRVWVLAAKIIGADDEDHEDDELIQPVYDAIMQTALSYAKEFGRRERIDEAWLSKKSIIELQDIAPPTRAGLFSTIIDNQSNRIAQLSQTVSKEANDE
jgi:hypothetical protein